MTKFELNNIDSEDIEDVLLKIEDSFNIKFFDNELSHIDTFGEMCDHIISKISVEHVNDCSSQQAFYKLRNSITKNLIVKNERLTPNTLLKDILPREIRREKVKQIENSLGFSINILRAPHFVTGILTVLFIIGLIVIYFKALIGISILTTSLLGLWVAKKQGIELEVQTLGDLAKKVTKENYTKSRRNPKSFNKNEIENIIRNWFIEDLGIKNSELSRLSTFN